MAISKRALGIIVVLVGAVALLSLFFDNDPYNEKPQHPYSGLTDPLFPCMFIFLGIRIIQGHSSSQNLGTVRYASTLRRGIAILLDGIFVLIPYHLFQNMMLSLGDIPYFLSSAFSTVVAHGVFLWMLTKYGATPGKLLTRIRVTRVDFSAIGMKEAIIRSSVELCFTALLLALSTYTLFHLDIETLRGLRYVERSKILMGAYPAIYFLINGIMMYWIWSEIVVMTCNPQRRAIHDYMAGTVVVDKKSLSLTESNS